MQNLFLRCMRTEKEIEELFQNHNIEHTITGRGGPAQGNQSVGDAASLFGQSSASASLVSSSSTSNPFASKPSGFSSSGFGSTVLSHAFMYIQSLTPSSPFGSTSSTSSLFSSQNPAFTPSMFSTTGSSSSGLSTPFGTSLAQGTTNTFGLSPNFSNSQSLPFFQSSTPSMPPSSSPFGQSMSSFGETTSAFSQNAFNPPSSGFGGNMFASTLSLGQRNIMGDPKFKKAKCAKGKQILNEGSRNGGKTTHLTSRRDDKGLKFIGQLNECNPAVPASVNAPIVNNSVEVKVSLLLPGAMIGGSILLIGAAGIFFMSRKCDDLISEFKLFGKDVLLEGKLTRSDIKHILERWADAGYPPLASLF